MLVFHHSAVVRGYVRKGHGYDEPYKGRFGKGVKRHIPNLECARKSTYYHIVEYYIEETNKA